MITGVVSTYEARIRIQVQGPNGQEHQVDAVIDTGYTASLTLPSSLVESLDLHWQSVGRGTLADGSVCLFDVYEAEVVWDGHVRRLLVDEADTDPLVGMGLLIGYELRMEVCSQGKLEITRLLA